MDMAKPSVKRQLAAVRQMFDYLVTGGILSTNPAASVRGPKYVVRRGKTPVLSAEQARQLLDSIDPSKLMGSRARRTNHRARPSCTIAPAIKSRSTKSSGSKFNG
jgi:site-specific recombinase XerC